MDGPHSWSRVALVYDCLNLSASDKTESPVLELSIEASAVRLALAFRGWARRATGRASKHGQINKEATIWDGLLAATQIFRESLE